MNTTPHRWDDHPLAQHAVRLAAEAGEPSTLRVLEEMLDLMHEVEDRFPGVSYSEIFRDAAAIPGHDIKRMRTRLRKAGACEADIAIVCPDNRALAERREALAKGDPYSDGAFFL